MAKLPELRRLTRAELEKLGLSMTSRRYVSAELKRVTKRSKTYSYRQGRQAQLGETLESYAKKREKLELTNSTPTDKTVVIHYNTKGGFEGLSAKERKHFSGMWKRLDEGELRAALNSPKVLVERRRISPSSKEGIMRAHAAHQRRQLRRA